MKSMKSMKMKSMKSMKMKSMKSMKMKSMKSMKTKINEEHEDEINEEHEDEINEEHEDEINEEHADEINEEHEDEINEGKSLPYSHFWESGLCGQVPFSCEEDLGSRRTTSYNSRLGQRESFLVTDSAGITFILSLLKEKNLDTSQLFRNMGQFLMFRCICKLHLHLCIPWLKSDYGAYMRYSQKVLKFLPSTRPPAVNI
ncbi:hypothetical protein CHS0354_014952 [Potamilus streckersoni]|uniref:Uncharacterized protein n=1 Tax=Potamilus streckersoni TaxID=2493646 RepID=A0AAE0S8B9_9BIVA|nr:hypothetical protein CHS0354_014952 [Potamilus streckersoni]